MLRGGYDCVYIPSSALSDGSHTVTISVQDNDGNISESTSVSFNIDTVPPQLNITSPSNNLVTNIKEVLVSGTTNDITSSPCVVTIKVNTIDQGTVTVQPNGSFSKSITLTEGTNNIEVKTLDSAGLHSIVTRIVKLDTIAPTINAITIAPNPVDCGKTFVITVEVTD